ncbi:uncharacterized protein LOC122498950 [Leptopilina heterotoma]|uniref:uncharacterized protein LOC122498950 n=1 Tax=Leptopilina heterotoma TaxID=63436 RepID=UPI001CAA2EFF|nr:uncharacterized protein LOC122498950 [Leptopilina heterotoma]
MENQLRFKGKFIKEKVLQQKLKRIKFLKEKQNEWRNITSKEKKHPCEGTRLVDLKLLGKNLKCRSCEKILLLENVVEEKRSGLHSTLRVMCDFCSVLSEVATGDQHNVTDQSKCFVKAKIHNDVNTNAVLGAFHAGIGHTQLNKILACLNVPRISTKMYKQYEQEVGPAIEGVARDSYKKSASEERKLVVEKMEELRDAL